MSEKERPDDLVKEEPPGPADFEKDQIGLPPRPVFWVLFFYAIGLGVIVIGYILSHIKIQF